ncbi:uncharacterized protein B0T23DRAFT_397636 [Neurospora hispaniola]|uniref:Uncharacterized protein n=1 Tax=Neurospora hispaniola TaxID=588809 RepID=A0AAJ0I3V1_9PEZI|nr:hypothetical protein B0T23DRAFT_397636 [Neurospora hispaniola]
MFRGGSTKPDQGAEGSRKPHQSPQAQRAYNQMRDVEEEFKRPGHFREALQQRERGRQNGISDSPYLEIPSPHIRRHRSRTGSIGSTGPASTQGSDGGVEDSGRKRRGHRTKPLEEPQRLRTAFIRTYVGACGECRTRKVKCTHFDDTELEANYQASKQSRHPLAPMSPRPQVPISSPGPYSPVQCPNELFGVGSHTSGCPNQPIVNHHDHLPDDIVLESPSTLVNTSRERLFLSREDAQISVNPSYSPTYSPAYSTPLGFDDSFLNSDPVSPMLSSSACSVGDVDKPLGLLISNSATNNLIWECKRGAVDPWAVTRTDSESYQCHARFPNHISFLDHYRTQHEPFVNEKIVRRCTCCGYFEGPFASRCTKCQNSFHFVCNASGLLDTWYYGTMMSPAPSLTAGTSTITTGQGFGNGLLGPPSFVGSNSSGPNSHVSNSYGSNSYGIYGSSYAGSMSNRTFGTAPIPRSEHASAHQAHHTTPKLDLARAHHNKNSISPTKEDHPTIPRLDHHYYHHHYYFPKKPFSFAKCRAFPTTVFLISVSAEISLDLINPKLNFCLALVHFLILLLLLPLGFSDMNPTTASSSSSMIERIAEGTLRYVGSMRRHGHIPFVPVVRIAVGVLGMWIVRSGSQFVQEVVAVEGVTSLLPMYLIA